MKRSQPLRRRKPMKRSPMRRRRRSTTYSRRERNTPFMLFVKKLACSVRVITPHEETTPTPCFGRVQADHMGTRGLGQKADDTTCAPMCERHHQERGDHAGVFQHMTRDELRAWKALAIGRAQHEWRASVGRARWSGR